MTLLSVALLLYVTWVFGAPGAASESCRGGRCFPGRDRSSACVGAYCGGATEVGASRRFHQRDARYSPPPAQRAPPQGADKRTDPRTVTAEVFHPRCAGGACPTTGSRDGAPRECKGTGCEPPHRTGDPPQLCGGGGCGARAGYAPVHVTDRGAQFLHELPVSGAERGAWIQLTCDMKPGMNELPPEDALVLQLQLSRGQEELVGALRGQQEEVKQLQRLLGEQQGALVHQQGAILEQQRRMMEQMEQVKAQYHLLMEGIKLTTLHQEELQSDREALREGVRDQQDQQNLQVLALHHVDVKASVMEVGGALAACGGCGPEEYCSVTGGRPRCEKCSVCPAGFFLVTRCSPHADRICQDRDECLETPELCGPPQSCLNTPGGFRCDSLTPRDAALGGCGLGYFYDTHIEECQACSTCEGGPVMSACTPTADAVCSTPPEGGTLSLSWAGGVTLHALQLHIEGRGQAGLGAPAGGGLLLSHHGLVWLDDNLSLRHTCRSPIQVCLCLNASDGSGGRGLSGVRVGPQEGRPLQSVSISGVAEVAPGDAVSLQLRSAHPPCNHSGDGVQLQQSWGAPFSLLWLSHDTGAVAMTAAAVVPAHHHPHYRLAFRAPSTSDPYVVGLTHDRGGVRFTESGSVRFVLQLALYAVGPPCVSDGLQLLAYLSHNGSGGELGRAFRPGPHYRDASLSLSGAAHVAPGDTLGFEVLVPPQCSVRFYGDDSGVSSLSLLWAPAPLSASLAAAVAPPGLPSGAVRNKPLLFRQTSPQVPQMELRGRGAGDERRDLVFREGGTASVALDLKLIHSCSLVKVTLLRGAGPEGSGDGGAARPVPLAQQVGGQTPEGGRWDGLSLRASFPVANGTAVFFTLDCVRGRVNQLSPHTGSGVSVLWVAA
ncbi:uncharacterized protein [Antennarius striatus]|uniref:uncharacterized protein n=1 Tax=Antennarius striatus TaxID=241820 RepID=UPI0035AEBA79